MGRPYAVRIIGGRMGRRRLIQSFIIAQTEFEAKPGPVFFRLAGARAFSVKISAFKS